MESVISAEDTESVTNIEDDVIDLGTGEKKKKCKNNKNPINLKLEFFCCLSPSKTFTASLEWV